MDSTSTLQLDFKRPVDEPVYRQPKAWRGFRVEQVVLETDEAYDFSAVGDTSYLAFHEMTLLDGELSISGLARVAKTELRNTLTFAPRGASIAGWAKPAPGRNSYTALYFDPEVISDDLGLRYAERDVAPFAYARDAALAATMAKLRDLTVAPDADDLYAEALCLAAALEIMGVRTGKEAAPLSKAQLQRVRDFVAAHQHEPITLDELAGVAGLSRSHFSRAFKASTGIGPYRFVNSARVRRAQEMLATGSDLTLDAVARAVGFSSASVLGRVFHQFVGETPQQYRRDRRSSVCEYQ